MSVLEGKFHLYMVRFTLLLSFFFLLTACASTSSKQVSYADTYNDGYSDIKKRDKTTPIDEIDDIDVAQPLAVQLSRLPGVRVTGHGASATVRIRGGSNSILASNDPLFVLDGQPLSGGYQALYAAVNAADIDRISVLKDASASIYGVRGANGVIIVKTKQ